MLQLSQILLYYILDLQGIESLLQVLREVLLAMHLAPMQY